MGPFIAKHLIKHFVTSNPTPGYIERIARVFNDDGNGERGNLKAVIKAILLDKEAFYAGNILRAISIWFVCFLLCLAVFRYAIARLFDSITEKKNKKL